MSMIKTKQHEWIIFNADRIRKKMEKGGCECIFFKCKKISLVANSAVYKDCVI